MTLTLFLRFLSCEGYSSEESSEFSLDFIVLKGCGEPIYVDVMTFRNTLFILLMRVKNHVRGELAHVLFLELLGFSCLPAKLFGIFGVQHIPELLLGIRA